MGKLWLSISHIVLQSSHVQLISTHLFCAVSRKNWTPVKTLLVARIRLKIINVWHPYYKSAEHCQPLTKSSILRFRFNHPTVTQKYGIAHRLNEKCEFSRIFASPEHARTSRTSYDVTLRPGETLRYELCNWLSQGPEKAYHVHPAALTHNYCP